MIKNYPNPFNSSTKISYFLNKSSDVNISIYNILGEKILNVKNAFIEKGHYSFNWNLKNKDGQNINSGVYFFIIKTDEAHISHKLILIK